MNVRELKDAIEDLSDDTVVVVKVPCARDEPYNYFGVEREAVDGRGNPAYGEELEEARVVDFRVEQDCLDNEDYEDYVEPWSYCVALITR